MNKIKKIKVSVGVYWIEIPDANLFILCGCPADAVKHLIKRGLIEEIEYKGGTYETGPNAILLSEVLIQNGSFANLTEFPVLQMFYLQGMIIPNHPNNVGISPMLIGTEQQVNAQLAYIYRGNYGLISEEEILATGVSKEFAEEHMRIKLNFAFGKITPPDQFLDKKIVKNQKVEIREGAFIERVAFNEYKFSYQDEEVLVNLNLTSEEKYQPSYQLGYHHIERDYFSVIHSGEGDGWDVNRPCMASVIVFQGKIYLIDAGPNILASLRYLGISANEIEGIFQTHAHDDHFAGLTTLIRTDRRFKYFATPLVRSAVSKKLAALMQIKEESFSTFFDIHDLEFDTWNNVDGLEVKPTYSPHPVETNIYSFRTPWKGRYKTYSHLADIIALDSLKKMVSDEPVKSGISLNTFKKIQENYLEVVDLKKIDIGGGMIHGNTEDFRNDESGKIVLAHTAKTLTNKQKEVGSSAAFGMVDVLIRSNHNYLIEFALDYLHFHFPTAPRHEIQYLLNHSIKRFNAGTILFKKDKVCDHVYLLLTGSISFTDSKTKQNHVFSAGSLVGFYAGYLGMNSLETYWASSNVKVLALPMKAYNQFVQRNNLYSELQRLEKNILFLESTWLFGEVVSFPILTKVARNMTLEKLEAGTEIDFGQGELLYVLTKGEVEFHKNDQTSKKLKGAGFFVSNSIFSSSKEIVKIETTKETFIYTIPMEIIIDIPVVYWKVLETFEKRKVNY
jgi:hemerythrin